MAEFPTDAVSIIPPAKLQAGSIATVASLLRWDWTVRDVATNGVADGLRDVVFLVAGLCTN